MAQPRTKRKASVFISHASADLTAAQEVEAALHGADFEVWLDRSDIRIGVLLGKELQEAIAASGCVVLLWSAAAKSSAWVATEILTAFHLDRFIVPCALDKTELPTFLSRSIYLDLTKERAAALARLPTDVKRTPKKRNEFPGVRIHQAADLQAVINDLITCQAGVTDAVGNNQLTQAEALQTELESRMADAEAKWPYDPTILALAGYHRKNSYMINHWAEYCASRFPKDPLLDQARDRFFETLMINPIDYNSLNGLGNIFLFQGELDAARFFVSSAIRCATAAGVRYQEAKNDLQVIEARLAGAC